MIRSDSELLDQIHELVTDHLEGGARGIGTKDNDSQSLQELISKDGRTRQLYLQYMQDSCHIRSRLVSDSAYFSDAVLTASLTDSGNSESKRRTALPLREHGIERPGPLWLATVSAIVIASGLLWLTTDLGGQKGIQQKKVSAELDPQSILTNETSKTVALLVRSNNAVWSDSDERLPDLSRLAVGQEVRLESGSAELVFDTGVEALLLAPAQLRVLGPDRVSSEYGRFSARVGSSGVGFVIETPMARVTDLGTEFGVSIADSGQTEVAVFEGEVDLEFGPRDAPQQTEGSGTRERLLQGEAVRIDSSGVKTRIVSIDDSHLPSVRQLPPVFHRLPAIGSVHDNINQNNPNSRKFYRIVHGGFREDCQAFVDRPHQWNGLTTEGLPQELIGADYVMPFNDDKFASDLEVEVLVTRPAVIYIFISDDVSVPGWLRRDFEDTHQDIGLDEGRNRFKKHLKSGIGPGKSIETIFSVWKQDVPSPRTVVLQSVEKPELKNGYNMYGIAVVGK